MTSDHNSLQILVADDTDTDRFILEAIVRKEGHTVISARDGLEAVEAFKTFSPDIVLLDALMPNLDGMGAARQIKAIAGDDLVPIIFLTSLTDTESLVSCLEAGGDDFLSKPYNKVILQAKIKAFNRMRLMHAVVQEQRDEISENNARLLNEQEVAKKVFDNVAHQGCLDAPMIRHYLSPMAVFNGDIIVSAFAPSGNMFVLLGDFTGHGLPAAIGAMPLASTFYEMVSRGYSMRDILKAINSKLKDMLPVGFFCCACLVEIDFLKGELDLWNGGLPDCYLYRAENAQIEPIWSTNLPLGVLGEKQFSDDCQYFKVSEGDRLFLWSDGIIESENTDTEMFGEERLKALFHADAQPESLFDNILDAVLSFIGRGEQADDLSLAEITMINPQSVSEDYIPALQASRSGANDWSFNLELRSETLKNFNPSPVLLMLLQEIPGLRGHLTLLYTVLTEFYSNALEHGLLGLDSALKKSADGFSTYYQMREDRLAELEQGFVVIKLDHVASESGGVLTIQVEDSGEGFNVSSLRKKLDSNRDYSGRGMALIHTLCDELYFNDKGNSVTAKFVWHYTG